jgi:hypothetical protein
MGRMTNHGLPEQKERSRRAEWAERIWRVLNAVVLVVAFSAPWYPMSRSGATGFYLTPHIIAMTITRFSRTVVIVRSFANMRALSYHVSWLLASVGLISTGVYWIVNGVRVFMDRPKSRLWLSIPLGVGVLGLIALMLLFSEPLSLSHCRWGYWLAWIGLGSSAVLEIVGWWIERMREEGL